MLTLTTLQRFTALLAAASFVTAAPAAVAQETIEPAVGAVRAERHGDDVFLWVAPADGVAVDVACRPMTPVGGSLLPVSAGCGALYVVNPTAAPVAGLSGLAACVATAPTLVTRTVTQFCGGYAAGGVASLEAVSASCAQHGFAPDDRGRVGGYAVCDADRTANPARPDVRVTVVAIRHGGSNLVAACVTEHVVGLDAPACLVAP